MKSTLDPTSRAEIIARISSLNESKHADWGKMNVYQMVTHCGQWDEMILKNKKFKRVFLGLILGRILLRNELKVDRQMRHNNPSIPELIVRETAGDFVVQKKSWISLVDSYSTYAVPDYQFIHPFFGRMSREEIGIFAYKHSDHHLRQFGC